MACCPIVLQSRPIAQRRTFCRKRRVGNAPRFSPLPTSTGSCAATSSRRPSRTRLPFLVARTAPALRSDTALGTPDLRRVTAGDGSERSRRNLPCARLVKHLFRAFDVSYDVFYLPKGLPERRKPPFTDRVPRASSGAPGGRSPSGDFRPGGAGEVRGRVVIPAARNRCPRAPWASDPASGWAGAPRGGGRNRRGRGSSSRGHTGSGRLGHTLFRILTGLKGP